MVAWKKQREHNREQGASGSIARRPRADYTSSPSGALHDFDGGRTRLLMPTSIHRQYVSWRDPKQRRLISRRGGGQLTLKPPPVLDSSPFFLDYEVVSFCLRLVRGVSSFRTGRGVVLTLCF